VCREYFARYLGDLVGAKPGYSKKKKMIERERECRESKGGEGLAWHEFPTTKTRTESGGLGSLFSFEER
jgi:hypothetical protein